MSSPDRPRDDDLEERLDELEELLAELRTDLQREERTSRGPPRPPRFSELLRFTEQYTIPTLIAVLETTIKSLELLRGTLRLADPGRDLDIESEAGTTGDRLSGVRDEATAGLARSLSELRTALSRADLPEDATSRSLLEDVRELTAEVESRVEEGRRRADAASRSGSSERDDSEGRPRDDPKREPRDTKDVGETDGAISIDVTDPADVAEESPDGVGDSDSGDADKMDGDAATADDGPEVDVDVDAELESIKRQFGETSDEREDADGRISGTAGSSDEGDEERTSSGGDEERTRSGGDEERGRSESGGDSTASGKDGDS